MLPESDPTVLLKVPIKSSCSEIIHKLPTSLPQVVGVNKYLSQPPIFSKVIRLVPISLHSCCAKKDEYIYPLSINEFLLSIIDTIRPLSELNSQGEHRQLQRTSIVRTWQNQRQPVTFYCGNLQWVLASPMWRLSVDYCKTDVLTSVMDLAVYPVYSETVSRHGCICPNLNIHFDLLSQNVVLSRTGLLLVFNVTCHICLGKAKIEDLPLVQLDLEFLEYGELSEVLPRSKALTLTKLSQIVHQLNTGLPVFECKTKCSKS